MPSPRRRTPQAITIATVNNGDMIRMQGLTAEFNKAHPDIKVNWVTLEENILRERVTTDIATGGGQYDIMTIGNYEVPIWGKQGWLVPLEFAADYDVDDLLPAIRGGLTVDDKLYAAPFYGESALLMYRTDLFEKAGLTMPDEPDLGVHRRGGAQDHRPRGRHQRHLPARQGRLGREHGADRLDGQHASAPAGSTRSGSRSSTSRSGRTALQFYADLMKDAGPPGASSNGFNENLTLFQQGKCGDVDRRHRRRLRSCPTRSKSTVADKVGFAIFPNKDGVDNHGNWLWSWNLAIPASSKNADAAKTFIEWATSKEYTELVAAKEGWANAPPGTRTSLYENQNYLDAAALRRRRPRPRWTPPTSPSRRSQPVPYTGGQFVAIPEFQSIGTTVGQLFSAVVAGQSSVDDALAQAQSVTEREMRRAGY